VQYDAGGVNFAAGFIVDNRFKIDSESLPQAVQPFLAGFATTADKIAALEATLNGTEGKYWRAELGKWTVRVLPVELLVPQAHREWRPFVREAILFVVSHLSSARLAPKIVEQIELPPETSPEARLLCFIAKVPGLQKIGQVLARNRNLHPRLRGALIKLENGISDVTIDDIRELVHAQLHPQLHTYAVKLDRSILSEASVSAVVRFTWRNPASQRRERGVFKVLKPHIPNCYAQDMKMLAQLARHLVRKHSAAGTNLSRLAEMLTEIRLLLEREVDFPREQATLANALSEYRSIRGVRVPSLIPALSSKTITALTFEPGKKVTQVHHLSIPFRMKVAERLTNTLLGVPVLSRDPQPIFHADPHAGNLLYDKRSNELVILDWALTERLARNQRKNVVLLVLMLILRDASGMCKAIEELCRLRPQKDRSQLRTIRKHVERVLADLPLTQIPGPMHALRLLDAVALEGIRFPAALLMFRKASFTLEGVVEDIAGSRLRLDSLVVSHAMANWKQTVATLFSLLSARDWLAIEWNALTFTSRMSARTLLRPWSWLHSQVTTVTDAA
jgi:ubiquinone biosynthesis protein